MMRLTPTALMPSCSKSSVAVVRIRSRGLADTMAATLLPAESGDERKLSLFLGGWSSQGEQQFLGLLEGGGGTGLAEEGEGPLELDPALGRAGREQAGGRGQAGGGPVR